MGIKNNITLEDVIEWLKLDYGIRLAKREDSDQILRIYRPFIEGTAVTFETTVPTAAAFAERVLAIEKEAPWFVCESNGMVVGYAYAGRHRVREAYRWTREVSVYVEEGHQGMGVASGLYTALLGVLRIQGYKNALAGITIPNPTSIRFHEGMGFRFVGSYSKVGHKLGRYHDVGWWELFLSDKESPPGDIMPTDLAVHTGEGRLAIEKGMSIIRDKTKNTKNIHT